jgi:hypothetical protein
MTDSAAELETITLTCTESTCFAAPEKINDTSVRLKNKNWKLGIGIGIGMGAGVWNYKFLKDTDEDEN